MKRMPKNKLKLGVSLCLILGAAVILVFTFAIPFRILDIKPEQSQYFAPKITFFRVESGRDSASIKWNVEGADEVFFYKGEMIKNISPENIDSERFSELGESYPPVYEMVFPIEEDSTLYLYAKNEFGFSIESRVVNIEKPIERIKDTTIWDKDKGYLGRMIKNPAKKWHIKLQPPVTTKNYLSGGGSGGGSLGAQITINPQIYHGGGATVEWQVVGADSYSMSSSISRTVLEPGTPEFGFKMFSGLVFGGIESGGGGMPITSILPSTSKSEKYSLNQPGGYEKGYGKRCVTAYSGILKTTADTWFESIPDPKFSGNGQNYTRKAEIQKAIKDIYTKLRTGKILNDNYLDGKVVAFQQKYIDRIEFYKWLYLTFQNLDLITIECNYVSTDDALKYLGQWGSSSPNIIKLCWSPTKEPALEYVILHEMIHKCGFNSYLVIKGQSNSSVENDAHAVTEAVYP